MTFLSYLFGIIAIVIGLKSIFTREASLSFTLWGDHSSRGGHGCSSSEHTGFIAVLIGIGQVAAGIGMIVKGPALLG